MGVCSSSSSTPVEGASISTDRNGPAHATRGSASTEAGLTGGAPTTSGTHGSKKSRFPSSDDGEPESPKCSPRPPGSQKPPPTPILKSTTTHNSGGGGGGGASGGGSSGGKKDRLRANQYIQSSGLSLDGGAAGGGPISPAGELTPLASFESASGRRQLSIDASIGAGGGGSARGASASPAPSEDPKFLRVASSPKGSGQFNGPGSSPKHGRHGSRDRGHLRKGSSRRSSEGRRILAEAAAATGGANSDGVRTPVLGDPRRLTGEKRSTAERGFFFGGGNSAAVGQAPPSPQEGGRRQPSYGGNRRRSCGSAGLGRPRRTSNNGMMSRLALQFPVVRASFLAVYRAFERYMLVVRRAEEVLEKRRSARLGNLGPLVHLRVGEESKTTLAGPGSSNGASLLGGATLQKQGTESHLPVISPTAAAAAAGPSGAGGPRGHHGPNLSADLGNMAQEPSSASANGNGGGNGGAGASTRPALLAAVSVAAAHQKAASGDGSAASDVEPDTDAEAPGLDGLSEEEQRRVEIQHLLAASPAPLLAVPTPEEVGAVGAVAAVVAPQSAAATNESGAAPAANASSTSPSAPSSGVLHVKELGTLAPERLGDALQAVTGSANPLPPGEIAELCRLCDLDHSASISFREFLIAVALGFFLREDLEKEKRAKEAALAASARGASPFSEQQQQQQQQQQQTLTSPPVAGPVGAPEASTGPPAVQVNNLLTRQPSGGSAAGASPPPPVLVSQATLPPLPVGTPVRQPSSSRRNLPPLSPLTPVQRSPTAQAAPLYPGAVITPPARPPSVPSTPSVLSEVGRGFRVVYTAFREMDSDGSGEIEAAELKRALFSAAPMRSDEALLERRFAELDFDNSKSVTLPEFLFGVVAWVGLLDEDELDPLDDPTAQGVNYSRVTV